MYWSKWLAAVVLLIVLNSCTATQITYNNAHLLLRLKAHQYFDLQDAQKTDFYTRLTRFHLWHRNQELPHYETLFGSAERRIAHGLAEEDIHWATSALRERYRILMHRAAEAAAPVLATLTPAQLVHLEKQFADDNRKFFKEHLAGSEDKRLKTRIDWAHKQFEDWFGSLTTEQEVRIAAMIKGGPSLADYRLEERKQNQQRFLELLRSHHQSSEKLAVALQDLLENIESHRLPASAQAMREAESQLIRLLLDLDKTLSPSQRAHASGRSASFAADFHALILKGRGLSAHGIDVRPIVFAGMTDFPETLLVDGTGGFL